VTVQALFQPLLVKEMADEADAATKHKETIQRPGFNYVLCFVFGKETA